MYDKYDCVYKLHTRTYISLYVCIYFFENSLYSTQIHKCLYVYIDTKWSVDICICMFVATLIKNALNMPVSNEFCCTCRKVLRAGCMDRNIILSQIEFSVIYLIYMFVYCMRVQVNIYLQWGERWQEFKWTRHHTRNLIVVKISERINETSIKKRNELKLDYN